MNAKPSAFRHWALVFIGGLVLFWCALLVYWIGPKIVWDQISAPGLVKPSGLASVGSSFGFISAVFSGLAVYLVYLTYSAQRDELKQLRTHFEMERRRQGIVFLLKRLAKEMEAVAGSMRQFEGRRLLSWMNGELESKFTDVAVDNLLTPTERWQRIVDAHALPDHEPCVAVVYLLDAIASSFVTCSEPEKVEIAAQCRTVITETEIFPLLYSCAMQLRRSQAALGRTGELFLAIGLRPRFMARLPLAFVPVSDVLTVEDTYFVEDDEMCKKR